MRLVAPSNLVRAEDAPLGDGTTTTCLLTASTSGLSSRADLLRCMTWSVTRPGDALILKCCYGRIQAKPGQAEAGSTRVYRKWESRSRSCPRRFSAGHSNQDWSENVTQWRQISSGISMTRRGMVAGAGQLCARTIGFCGSLRREWRGLRGGRDADRIRRHVEGVTRSDPAGAAFGSLTRRARRTGGSW